MSAPKVTIKEQDLSVRVPSFPGVYAGIAIDARRGPTEPTLVTSEKQLLDLYTVDGRIPRNVSNSLLSAMSYLRYSDKLWVVRAVSNDDKYAGIKYGLDSDGNPVVTPLATGLGSPEEIGAPGGLTLSSSDRFVLLAADPGNWPNGNLKVIFESIRTNGGAPEVPSPWHSNAFVIRVFFNNVQVERWVVSLDEAAVDGNGVSIFLNSVLARSAYIRGYANPGRGGNSVGTLPASGSSGPIYAFAGGVSRNRNPWKLHKCDKEAKGKGQLPLDTSIGRGFRRSGLRRGACQHGRREKGLRCHPFCSS
jgi:hypothetical protein